MPKLKPAHHILPYSKIVGQDQAKLALELAYISRQRINGVLLSGQRGTAKSTLVRAFSNMMYGELPVTLPINATEDRVLGGWEIDALMESEAKKKDGLLLQADKKILYVDEINLLDDHLVNLILDAAAMGVVSIQREGQDDTLRSEFILVGTMNPEEGGLRPQLLDRFGLMVTIATNNDRETRQTILRNVLEWDETLENAKLSDQVPQLPAEDKAIQEQLNAAQRDFHTVKADGIIGKCIDIAEKFQVTGHRGELTMALAARAYAARENQPSATPEHLLEVAPMTLQHRRMDVQQSEQLAWSADDQKELEKILA